MSSDWAPLLIKLGYACYWVEVSRETGAVEDAPPIARWMIGKHYEEVWRWVERKSGSVCWINDSSASR